MRAYLDLWTGLSGDMMVGALLGAGWPESEMLSRFFADRNPRCAGPLETRSQKGLAGFGIRVEANGEPPERSFADIRRILAASKLSASVRARSLALLHRLAVVEGSDSRHRSRGRSTSTNSAPSIRLPMSFSRWPDWSGSLSSTCLAVPIPLSRGEVRTAHGSPSRSDPRDAEPFGGTSDPVASDGRGVADPHGRSDCGGARRTRSVPRPRCGSSGWESGPGPGVLPTGPTSFDCSSGTRCSPTEESIGWVSILETNLDDLDPRHEAEVVRRLPETRRSRRLSGDGSDEEGPGRIDLDRRLPAGAGGRGRDGRSFGRRPAWESGSGGSSVASSTEHDDRLDGVRAGPDQVEPAPGHAAPDGRVRGCPQPGRGDGGADLGGREGRPSKRRAGRPQTPCGHGRRKGPLTIR